MTYTLRIFTAEDVSPAERTQAEKRFRFALEASLGDATLVLPAYLAYLRLVQLYGTLERPWPMSDEEHLLAGHWETAELAATQAAFGVDRYMGDAEFEISP
ncbi:MAG: hypothetical protein V4614_10190 [Pseudomonadota bacterium]